jgi:hypothetical protein
MPHSHVEMCGDNIFKANHRLDIRNIAQRQIPARDALIAV